jgi:hypothetical protein
MLAPFLSVHLPILVILGILQNGGRSLKRMAVAMERMRLQNRGMEQECMGILPNIPGNSSKLVDYPKVPLGRYQFLKNFFARS